MNAPSKIVLGSSSKVSLHDRFTKLSKAKPTVSENKPAVLRASAKNRNLAMSMANKPSVQAALSGRAPAARPVKRPSLNQRLGTGNRIDSSRLGIGRKGAPKQQGPPQRKLPLQQRLSAKQGAGVSKGKVAISRVGPRGGIGLKNRVKFLKQNNANIKQKMQKPGIKAALVKKGKKVKPNAAAKPKVKEDPKNKETLDMDLDKYMSKTKHSLDNDLDTYMAQAN